MSTIPKPCEHDGGGFAKTGWDVDESRIAFRATGEPSSFGTAIAFTTCQAALIVVGSVVRGPVKKGRKCHIIKD